MVVLFYNIYAKKVLSIYLSKSKMSGQNVTKIKIWGKMSVIALKMKCDVDMFLWDSLKAKLLWERIKLLFLNE